MIIYLQAVGTEENVGGGVATKICDSVELGG